MQRQVPQEKRQRLVRLLIRFMLAAAILFPAAAAAQTSPLPKLWTHESYIDDVTGTDKLDVDDPLKVFAFVLNSLPSGVHVYPTENYYYFRFLHNGTPYSGNIRIEVSDREPALHFAYYKTETPWHPEENAKEVTLGKEQGVLLEKKDRFLYRVAYQDKSVLFALNDLSKARPPADGLAPGEHFIGPIFDDSGVRFFLVFNSRLKLFLYVLDETAKPTEELLPLKPGSRISLGRRTGFAYFQDLKLDRKILIGVLEDNLLLNTYFDGPFDQLPDNFIEGDTLREAILAVSPQLAGRIDRYGRALDRNIRYSIKPYLAYVEPKDLEPVEACANKRRNGDGYYECFDADKRGQANAGQAPAKQKAAGKKSAGPRSKKNSRK